LLACNAALKILVCLALCNRRACSHLGELDLAHLDQPRTLLSVINALQAFLQRRLVLQQLRIASVCVPLT
jgi:hypothetical protein